MKRKARGLQASKTAPPWHPSPRRRSRAPEASKPRRLTLGEWEEVTGTIAEISQTGGRLIILVRPSVRDVEVVLDERTTKLVERRGLGKGDRVTILRANHRLLLRGAD